MVETSVVARTPALDRAEAVRRLTVAVRLGAILLASGSGTEDVESTIRRLAIAYGLADAQAAVTLGTIMLSAFVQADEPPITELQLVRVRAYDYRRLTDAAALADRIEQHGLDADDALAAIASIERDPLQTSRLVPIAAGAGSAAASTVLFGGSALDAAATLGIGIVIGPIVEWLDRSSGLPPFFQTLLAPFLATLAAVALVAAGLPIDGSLVITGSILRFLPGAALTAGMRDLIDGSIISGSARLAEALLMGAAVGLGTATAIQVGVRLGAPELVFGLVTTGSVPVVLQVVAAAFASGLFAVRLGVPVRQLASVFLLAGLAWAIFLAVDANGHDDVLALTATATVVGAIGQWLAHRTRLPAVIWIVPAILPLLPGLTLVQGILAIATTSGILQVIGAVGIGLALGMGVALGSIIVATVRRVNEDLIAPIVIEPVSAAISTGLERVARPGDRSVARGSRATRTVVSPDPNDATGAASDRR